MQVSRTIPSRVFHCSGVAISSCIEIPFGISDQSTYDGFSTRNKSSYRLKDHCLAFLQSSFRWVANKLLSSLNALKRISPAVVNSMPPIHWASGNRSCLSVYIIPPVLWWKEIVHYRRSDTSVYLSIPDLCSLVTDKRAIARCSNFIYLFFLPFCVVISFISLYSVVFSSGSIRSFEQLLRMPVEYHRKNSYPV